MSTIKNQYFKALSRLLLLSTNALLKPTCYPLFLSFFVEQCDKLHWPSVLKDDELW
jgi:hypothetical protein